MLSCLTLIALVLSSSNGENTESGINIKAVDNSRNRSYLRRLETNNKQCERVWNIPATDRDGTHTCGQRIFWLKSSTGGKMTEREAEDQVATDFPSLCGPCGTKEKQEKTCDDVWNLLATGRDGKTFSCGKRIEWLMSKAGGYKTAKQASNQIASDFPSVCGPCQTKEPAETTCDDVWDYPAAGSTGRIFTCGERINWLKSAKGGNMSDQQAKNQIAIEFASICGACSNGGSNRTLKCGGAVDAGRSNCRSSLWEPASNPLMHCYAYGGNDDPCALHNNNDLDDGLSKDPSNCREGMSDTFYLWDEPDTQGKSYSWAGTQWAAYAIRYKNQIKEMRQRGIKFTTPMIIAGGPGAIKERAGEFYRACGDECRDPNSPAYIDIIAVNAFCGPWNINDPSDTEQGCRNGASFVVDEVKKLSSDHEGGDLPVYITNWSRLHTSKTADQLAAMDATDEFFKEDSPVQRVYWFGARDFGGGSSKNYLTDTIESGARAGKSLGEVWNKECNSL